jgi:hypothetical protein
MLGRTAWPIQRLDLAARPVLRRGMLSAREAHVRFPRLDTRLRLEQAVATIVGSRSDSTCVTTTGGGYLSGQFRMSCAS